MSKLTPVPPPNTPQSQDFYTQQEVDTLARTLWGEARGEGTRGMEAVACVILNRVAVAKAKGGRYWWGGDVISVCLKPWQFSCWNRADPNYPHLQAITQSDPVFAAALAIAQKALNGSLPDITNGATHYHARGIKPTWAIGKTPTTRIGRHVFYCL